jgi:peptidoglycan/xylan/chitin deacetylase (PgdA/CDA1 family)
MQRRFTHYQIGFCAVLVFLFLFGCSAPAEDPQVRNSSFQNTVVSLTFDDGDKDNFSVRQDLSRNNLYATFYIVSSFIGTDGYMSEPELLSLYQDGNEIGGHSFSHARLIDIHGDELKYQICQDRSNLQALGFDVVSFAYPGGAVNDETKQTVKDCGYRNARVVVDGPETIPPADPFALRAMPYIVDDTRLAKIQRYINSTQEKGGGWVILIFHHVCDGCDYYSISPNAFTKLADWLGEQQKNGLVIRTIRDVTTQSTP